MTSTRSESKIANIGMCVSRTRSLTGPQIHSTIPTDKIKLKVH